MLRIHFASSFFALIVLTFSWVNAIPSEVDTAYSELLSTTSETLQQLKLQSNDLQNNLEWDLEDLRIETTVEITSKVQEIIEKMDSMNKNVAKSSINVTDCTDKGLNYLLVYRDALLLRASECVDTFGSEGLDYLKAAYSEVEKLADNHLTCIWRSITLCDLGNNDKCFAEVLKNINSDQEELQNNLNLLSLEAENRYKNFQTPCKEMILNDMALYLPALLKTTENCVNSMMKMSIKGVCAS